MNAGWSRFNLLKLKVFRKFFTMRKKTFRLWLLVVLMSGVVGGGEPVL